MSKLEELRAEVARPTRLLDLYASLYGTATAELAPLVDAQQDEPTLPVIDGRTIGVRVCRWQFQASRHANATRHPWVPGACPWLGEPGDEPADEQLLPALDRYR